MNQDLQRRVLLAQDGQRIALLEECCQSDEGRAWARQRFSVFDVLDWMWKEGRGSKELLGCFEGGESPLMHALAPDSYLPARLVSMLFPLPGRYRLDENGVAGPHSTSVPPALIPLVKRRVRELKPMPHGLRLRESARALELVPEESSSRIVLTQGPLEESGAEVVAYGAKDTGEMGGGAAGALLVAAGSPLEDAARRELARTEREVGVCFITPAFGKLLAHGTHWVCHIVSIIKHTDQGSWCPFPQKLEAGVERALELADEKGALSIAFSALGTGEGRVAPELCARLMLDPVKRFLREHPETTLRVLFCLPNDRDLEAFERHLAGG